MADEGLYRGVVLGWKLAAVYLADESREWADSDESLDLLLEAVEKEDL